MLGLKESVSTTDPTGFLPDRGEQADKLQPS
jgi:hypothetical protein